MTDSKKENASVHQAGNTFTGDNDWKPCPPGVLVRLSAETRQRIWRQQITKVVGIGGSVCALLVAALLTFQSFGEADGSKLPRYGGLVCTEVIAEMDSFFAQELQQDRDQRVRKHLADCQRCRLEFESEAEDLGLSPTFLAGRMTDSFSKHTFAKSLRNHSLVDLLAVLQARSPVR